MLPRFSSYFPLEYLVMKLCTLDSCGTRDNLMIVVGMWDRLKNRCCLYLEYRELCEMCKQTRIMAVTFSFL